VVLLALSWGCSIILPLDEYPTGDGATPEAGSADSLGDRASAEASVQADAGDGSSREAAADGSTPQEAGTPDAGTCLDKCSSAWCDWPTGITTALRSVHGTGLENLWAAGDQSKVLRFEPKTCTWIDQPPPAKSAVSFRAVRARSATEVHVVSSVEEMWRLDSGKSWTQVALCSSVSASPLNALGEAGGKLFAAGDGGLTLAYNGSCWDALQSLGTGKQLLALSGSSKTLHVGGTSGLLQERDVATGTSFVDHACAQPASVTVRGLWTDDAGTVLVAVGESDGGEWHLYTSFGCSASTQSSAPPLRAVDGTGPKDVWLVGDGGQIVQFDATTGNMKQIAGPGSKGNLTSVWTHGEGASTWVVVTSETGKVFARLF